MRIEQQRRNGQDYAIKLWPALRNEQRLVKNVFLASLSASSSFAAANDEGVYFLKAAFKAFGYGSMDVKAATPTLVQIQQERGSDAFSCWHYLLVARSLGERKLFGFPECFWVQNERWSKKRMAVSSWQWLSVDCSTSLFGKFAGNWFLSFIICQLVGGRAVQWQRQTRKYWWRKALILKQQTAFRTTSDFRNSTSKEVGHERPLLVIFSFFKNSISEKWNCINKRSWKDCNLQFNPQVRRSLRPFHFKWAMVFLQMMLSPVCTRRPLCGERDALEQDMQKSFEAWQGTFSVKNEPKTKHRKIKQIINSSAISWTSSFEKILKCFLPRKCLDKNTHVLSHFGPTNIFTHERTREQLV